MKIVLNLKRTAVKTCVMFTLAGNLKKLEVVSLLSLPLQESLTLVHTEHISKVRVLRRDSVLRCLHCINVELTTEIYMFIYKIGKKSKTVQIMSFLDIS